MKPLTALLKKTYGNGAKMNQFLHLDMFHEIKNLSDFK